ARVPSPWPLPQGEGRNEYYSSFCITSTSPRGDAHLLFAEVGEIRLGGAAFEADFVVLGREVGGAFALEERDLLALEIGGVLRAVGRGADIDDVAVAAAAMLVLDRVHDIRMPPYGVAGLHQRDRRERRHQHGMPVAADRERAAGLGAAQH